MTPEQMKVALGILTEAMASAAFRAHDLDGGDCQALLLKAGLSTVRPATAEDIDGSECAGFMEPGDDWHALTPFAIECKRLAQTPPAPEPSGLWLIWKRGRGYYRPNRSGYTDNPDAAGRYTRAEAEVKLV